MADLIIVGNGFDLAHEMKTRYNDFRDYLVKNHAEILDSLESNSLLNKQELWSDFENNLSKMDFDGLFYNSLLATQRGSKDDDYFSGEDDGVSYFLSNEIGFIHSWSDLLNEWIENNVELPEEEIFSNKIINDNNFFLSFNYTETLEYLYSIEDNRVLHIHGRSGYELPLVMGHGDEEIINVFKDDLPDHVHDPKRNAAYNIFLKYLTKSRKAVNEIIEFNDLIFDFYKDVKNIHIIGFSFSKIDIPYIDAVLSYVSKDSKIYIYYHDDISLNNYKKILKDRFSNRIICYKDIASIKE